MQALRARRKKKLCIDFTRLHELAADSELISEVHTIELAPRNRMAPRAVRTAQEDIEAFLQHLEAGRLVRLAELRYRCANTQPVQRLGNSLGRYFSRFATALPAALLSLDLEHNSVRDAGAAVLAAALATNDSLQILQLKFNDIGDDGAAALASMLATNRALTKLNLRGNTAIGPAGARALANVLCSAGEAAALDASVHASCVAAAAADPDRPWSPPPFLNVPWRENPAAQNITLFLCLLDKRSATPYDDTHARANTALRAAIDEAGRNKKFAACAAERAVPAAEEATAGGASGAGAACGGERGTSAEAVSSAVAATAAAAAPPSPYAPVAASACDGGGGAVAGTSAGGGGSSSSSSSSSDGDDDE